MIINKCILKWIQISDYIKRLVHNVEQVEGFLFYFPPIYVYFNDDRLFFTSSYL
jgi:hypothetical protein